ncbi:MAG TPA: DoxX family protein [Chitinophagaceae bacterium]|nr:DoxX family protein [Chitinophagaceae bacterium]
MKTTNIIYWISTGIVSAVMLFSIINFTFFDHVQYPEGAFVHLGLPEYFKVELTIAKILGLLVLLLPAIPLRLKEFAYFGFGLTLLSACVAHYSSGDNIWHILDPFFFFCVLVVSYIYWGRKRRLGLRIGDKELGIRNWA